MNERVNRTYKAAELVAAQQALMHNGFHDFNPDDASAIIIALFKLGFRIVKVNDELPAVDRVMKRAILES